MSKIDALKTELSQLRDEAKLKVELGRMEVREQWEELEAKWNHFTAQARVHESEQGIKTALANLGEELREAYHRLKNAL